jgi:hypothetical protein
MAKGKWMAQMDSTGLVFSILGVIFAINSIGIGIMLGLRKADKKEFEKHKESVQYKDTCTEVVKRIDKCAEERHKTVTDSLERIEGLIRKNGNSRPRVQT